MEETEAMASQLSSLDIADDIFSKIPEHIIHCILGFLPCIKDVVRTSIISKTWLQALRTFPITEFNLQDFLPGSKRLSSTSQEIEAKGKHFIGFVDNRLQNGDGNGDVMKIFNLSTVNKMADHTTRWVGMALDNKVEHLALRIFVDGSLLPCLIPDRILYAYWLKSLILVGPTICLPLTESSRVDLPSLTSIHIQWSDIRDEQLQKLLSGCPVLEDIALLNCDKLSKVDIFDHPNLETLEVTGTLTKAAFTAIRITAPKLKSFSYTCLRLNRHSDSHDVVVEIHNSPELKSLTICDWNKTEMWLHKFIDQFPLLEHLTIDGLFGLRKIRFSHPLLDKINIMNCFRLEDVIISCKKLASLLLLTLPSSILHTSIRMEMDNPLNDCTAQIAAPAPLRFDLMMKASWYCKLKEFLTKHFIFKSLTISVQALSAVDGDMNGKHMHKKLPPVACNIEKLRLEIDTAPSSCHLPILNGLLSACHPTTIKLDVISNMPFVKLVCEELCNRGNKRKCFCKGAFKCWKHQLKEIKIEKITGIKLEEDLDRDVLFGLLPTLEAGNDIYFKLMW